MPIERYTPIPWDVLQAQAEALAGSAFVPAPYRGNPGDVLAAGLYGQEIGLGISASLSYIHVVQGRPTLSAEGMVALVRARGHSVSGTSTALAATVRGKRADTGDEMTVEWTMDMAKRAGLAGKETWKAYPEAMLWARAVSQLARMLFPDVLLGLSYTPEEARDMDAVEVLSVVTNQPGAPGVVEEPPAPLREISQPSPTGTETSYVNEDGELLSRKAAEDEMERRRLAAEILAEKEKLGPEGLKAWDQARINNGFSLTKLMRDHTLQETQELKAMMAAVVARSPF